MEPKLVLVLGMAIILGAITLIVPGPKHSVVVEAPSQQSPVPVAAPPQTASFPVAAPIWSSTGSETAEQNARKHWQKHGAEFPELHSYEQYVQAATSFVNNPPPSTLKKVDHDGDMLFYHPESNTFAVRSTEGVPRTMFRPSSGMRYWQRQ